MLKQPHVLLSPCGGLGLGDVPDAVTGWLYLSLGFGTLESSKRYR